MKQKKPIALLLSLAILSGCLSGCGGVLQELANSVNSSSGGMDAWVNAAIVGAIDENTPVDPKQDFYLAVNKDWILEHGKALSEDKPADIALFGSETLVRERKRELLNPQNELPANGADVGLSEEELNHARELITVFSEAAGNFDRRDALGAEPLRPYLEDLENIASMEEFSRYLVDMENRNFLGTPVVQLNVDATLLDRQNHYLCARPISKEDLFLRSTYGYDKMGRDEFAAKEVTSLTVRLVLELLGYDDAYATRLIQNSYRLEKRIADHIHNVNGGMAEDYEKEYGVDCTPEELSEILGDYPVKELLAGFRFDTADSIRVFDTDYMQNIGKLYTDRYLEQWKSYYIVHTILECAGLLDCQTQMRAAEIRNRGEDETQESLSTGDDTQDNVDMLLKDYITPYLAAPFEMLYIASYCSSEEKAAVTEVAANIKRQMNSVLEDADWLSEESIALAKEKLDNMPIHVLYPDKYISYLNLNLTPDMSLPDMVRNIRLFNIRKQAAKINQPVDRMSWDLAVMPTTTVNAFNDFQSNSVYILAGYIADHFSFNPDTPLEVQYARLGTTVGHEITHAFDTTGYQYDKNGFQQGTLFRISETMAFSTKAGKLEKWYTALTPVPGMGSYHAQISGEAIADMGGMKCALLAAKEIPGFDYDTFFRAYAGQWAKVNTQEVEMSYAQSDAHPLAFLRTNVTLKQFDEFMKTYNVQPGDGMYTDPESRILVW